jgi:cobalt-zinc-cadmium resistance protein CzcA
MKANMKNLLLACALAWSIPVPAQPVTEPGGAVDIALANNAGIKASRLDIEQARRSSRTYADPGRTSVSWMSGQYNSASTDNSFTVSQSIPFPLSLARQSQLGKLAIRQSEVRRDQLVVQLAFDIKSEWYRLAYLLQRQKLLDVEDSLFEQVARANEARVRAGEGRVLDQLTAQTQWMEFVNLVTRNQADIRICRNRLSTLIGQETDVSPSLVRHTLVSGTDNIDASPALALAQLETTTASKNRQVKKSGFLPDFQVGYFNQSLTGYQRPLNGSEVYYDKSTRFDGFMLGVSLPLWFGPQHSRLQAARFQEDASTLREQYLERMLDSELRQAREDLLKQEASLEYYESFALANSSLMLTQARKEYAAGQITLIEYLFATRNALLLQNSYIETLNAYNQVAVRIEYLCGRY